MYLGSGPTVVGSIAWLCVLESIVTGSNSVQGYRSRDD